MKIEAVVKAGSKISKVERIADGIFHIRVKEPAREGRANNAVIKALALYFHIPKQAISITHGHLSHKKIILISK